MADDEERRSLERRVFELERTTTQLLLTTAVTEAKVSGLVSTIESKFKAFDRGQDLILTKLEPLESLVVQELPSRVASLEEVKNKAAGALTLVQILGVVGIVGGVVAIAQMVLQIAVTGP